MRLGRAAALGAGLGGVGGQGRQRTRARTLTVGVVAFVERPLGSSRPVVCMAVGLIPSENSYG